MKQRTDGGTCQSFCLKKTEHVAFLSLPLYKSTLHMCIINNTDRLLRNTVSTTSLKTCASVVKF